MFLKFVAAAVVVFSGLMPDPSKTPGALNPNVTQSNIQQTICVPGFTSTIRPPSSYTTALKVHQLRSGYAVNGDYNTGDYEEDHLISLELGGAPSDPRNLWPEPYSGNANARVKDKIENKLHSLVCSGAITLRLAQRMIATNWEDAYIKYFGSLPSGGGSVTSNVVPKSKKGLDPRFATCKAANKAGYGPYFKKYNPEYFWYRDANSDGKVC
ncbi:MAG: excalibur calcium-binding domain-containing protein [Micrococcales bacterium]